MRVILREQGMPLIATNSNPRVRSDRPHQGFLFDMLDQGRNQLIRVLVTAKALHEHLDGNLRPRDRYVGRLIFDEHRKRIEAAASRKYDLTGVDDELEGQPLLLIKSVDL